VTHQKPTGDQPQPSVIIIIEAVYQADLLDYDKALIEYAKKSTYQSQRQRISQQSRTDSIRNMDSNDLAVADLKTCDGKIDPAIHGDAFFLPCNGYRRQGFRPAAESHRQMHATHPKTRCRWWYICTILRDKEHRVLYLANGVDLYDKIPRLDRPTKRQSPTHDGPLISLYL